jgi:hypothetical protein
VASCDGEKLALLLVNSSLENFARSQGPCSHPPKIHYFSFSILEFEGRSSRNLGRTTKEWTGSTNTERYSIFSAWPGVETHVFSRKLQYFQTIALAGAERSNLSTHRDRTRTKRCCSCTSALTAIDAQGRIIADTHLPNYVSLLVFFCRFVEDPSFFTCALHALLYVRLKAGTSLRDAVITNEVKLPLNWLTCAPSQLLQIDREISLNRR